MNTKQIREFISQNIIECDAGYRGGNIKVDVASLFPEVEDEDTVIGAYQNYLGGGMLGAVVGASMFDFSKLSVKQRELAEDIKEQCKVYLHNATNHIGDEWEETTYVKNQAMPVSAY